MTTSDTLLGPVGSNMSKSCLAQETLFFFCSGVKTWGTHRAEIFLSPNSSCSTLWTVPIETSKSELISRTETFGSLSTCFFYIRHQSLVHLRFWCSWTWLISKQLSPSFKFSDPPGTCVVWYSLVRIYSK